jgi:hypoxanthine phosphoribosyltransferase
VEDIMDSGLTLQHLKQLLGARNPKSMRIACLLDKPSRRECDIAPDYCGFTIPNKFVVGYGLDYMSKYRQFPYVGVLKPEIYSE